MLWMTFGLGLVLALIALAYVLWPMIMQDAPLLAVEDDRFVELLAHKDRVLRSLKELEFDHQVGKIGDEDFQRFNYRLSRQAIALIQQVEKMTPVTSELDDALEAEIAQLRKVQATARVIMAPAITNGVQETVAPTAEAPLTKVHFCTECGTKVEPAFKFCANCGAALTVPMGHETATI